MGISKNCCIGHLIPSPPERPVEDQT